jgi:serine/threonine protein kinase
VITLDVGTTLGRYEIRSKIGEGGMGEVYLAEDTKLDRRVALKILLAEVASKQERMARFVREAKPQLHSIIRTLRTSMGSTKQTATFSSRWTT